MDLKKIATLYSNNIEEFGIDSRSVGWNSPESQELRFRKLLQVIEDQEDTFTMNELGCGYGELVRHMDAHGFKMSHFNGYDISEKMLEAAKEYLKDYKSLSWHCTDRVTEMADYTITSGIFNVRFDTEKSSWEEYIKDVLRNMMDHSNKGIAFNLLTKYVDYEAADLNYADPMYYFNFCKEELSKKVTLLHDYDLYEWTIYVRK